MRISHFTISNYKGIEHVQLWMPRTVENRSNSGNLLSIIGKNNAGKSSILQALHKALELSRVNREDFPQHTIGESTISVDIAFDDLSESDKAKPAVRSYYAPDDSYIIRIEWNKPGTAPTRKVRDFIPEYRHPENSRKKESWTKHPEWQQAVVEFERVHGSFSVTKDNIARLEEIASQKNLKALFSISEWQNEDNYRSNPGGWQSLLLNAMPRVVYVPAIRDPKDEAEVSKRGASIRQLVQHLFESKLDKHEAIQLLKRAANQVSKLFSKQGKSPIVAELENTINNVLIPLADVTGRLNFIPDNVGLDLTGYSDFWMKDKFGPETKPEHQGHGSQRALILSLLQALAELEAKKSSARGLLLLFEEPEIYLHPEMCRKMRDTLIMLSRKNDTQVICTTHSPVLLDLAERHDGIALLRKSKENGKVTYFQRSEDIFDEEKQKEERQRLRMVLDFDPAVNELFFTDHVCLVEGDTEVAALNATADKLVEAGRIDRALYRKARHDVTVLNCRSKSTMPAFQHVLNEFRIKYRVVHDSDTDKGSKGSITINKKIEGLLKVSHPNDWQSNILIHDPDFDQHVFGEVFDDDKPWRAYRNITERTNIDNAKNLLAFFEFCLHKPISELEPKPLTDAVPHGGDPCRFAAPRRDTRGEYTRYREVFLRTVTSLSATQVIGIAAGHGEIEGLSEFGTSDHLGSDYVIARVNGDSMLNTLIDGDMILLKKLDVSLGVNADEENMISIDDFRKKVNDDRIYVLAINEDIEDLRYTIKRVRYSGTEKNWICRIVADNPDANWFSRGEFVVRRTDRIHFAAELVSLVKDFERPYPVVDAVESGQMPRIAQDKGKNQ